MKKAIAIAVLVLLATLGASAYTFYLSGPSSGSSNGPSTSSGPNTGTSGQAGAGSGTMNLYLAAPPPQNQSLKYLLINVTSITIKYSSNVTESTSTTSSSTSSSSASTGSTTTTSSSSSTTSGSGFVPMYVFNVSSSVGTNVNLTKLQGPGILLGSPKVPAGNVTGIILNITGAEAFWTNGNHTQLKVVADGKLMINVHFTVQKDGTTDLTLNISPGDIHVSPGQASVLRPVVMVTAVSNGPQGSQTVVTTETETESSSTSSG